MDNLETPVTTEVTTETTPTEVVEETTTDTTEDTDSGEWTDADEIDYLRQETGESDIESIQDVLKKYNALKQAGVTKPTEETKTPERTTESTTSGLPFEPKPVLAELRKKYGSAVDSDQFKTNILPIMESVEAAMLKDRAIFTDILSEVAQELRKLSPVAQESEWREVPAEYRKVFARDEVNAYMKQNRLSSYKEAVMRMVFNDPSKLKAVTNGNGQKQRPANFGTQPRGSAAPTGKKPVDQYKVNGVIPKDSPFWKDYGADAQTVFLKSLET